MGKVNLFELLDSLSLGHDVLKGQDLETIRMSLMLTPEFEDVSELIIMNTPFSLTNEKGTPIKTNTSLFVDGTKLSGKVYIYSLGLTPNMFSPLNLESQLKKVLFRGIYESCTTPSGLSVNDGFNELKLVQDISYFLILSTSMVKSGESDVIVSIILNSYLVPIEYKSLDIFSDLDGLISDEDLLKLFESNNIKNYIKHV